MMKRHQLHHVWLETHYMGCSCRRVSRNAALTVMSRRSHALFPRLLSTCIMTRLHVCEMKLENEMLAGKTAHMQHGTALWQCQTYRKSNTHWQEKLCGRNVCRRACCGRLR